MEHVPPPEIPPTEEQLVLSPIDSYLATSPEVQRLPPEELRTWCEAAEGTRDPKERYHLGWMWLELGKNIIMSTLESGQDWTAVSPEVHRYFGKAESVWQDVITTPSANRMIKAQALVAQKSTILHHLSVLQGSQEDITTYLTYFEGQLLSAAQSVLGPRFRSSAEDMPFMHSLTAMLLANGGNSKNVPAILRQINTANRPFILLPAPSRFSESSQESSFAYNLIAWDYKDKDRRQYRLRTGHRDTIPACARLSPKILSQHNYASNQHDFGTLQALIDTEQRTPSAGSKEHTLSVRKEVNEHLVKEVDAMHRPDALPASPLDWYDTLPPHKSPTIENAYLEAALSDLEIAYLERKLGPHAMYAFACMRAEFSANRAEFETPISTASGFDRAADICDKVVEKKWERKSEGSFDLLRLNALITKEAITVQKMVATQPEQLADHLVTYGETMCDLASRVIESYDELRGELIQQGNGIKAADDTLHRMLYTLTMCISSVSSEDPYKRYIVYPSFPRQQGSKEHAGCDIVVLPANGQGAFSLLRQGRIRFVDQVTDSEQLLFNSNVLALTPEDLGHQPGESYATAGVAISSMLYPENVSEKEEARLKYLRLKISEATQYASFL